MDAKPPFRSSLIHDKRSQWPNLKPISEHTYFEPKMFSVVLAYQFTANQLLLGTKFAVLFAFCCKDYCLIVVAKSYALCYIKVVSVLNGKMC